MTRISERKPKKKPEDYPTMIFRVGQEDKDRLNELIDRVLELANADADKDKFKRFRKNDVIVDALFLGLLSLEKKLTRKAKGVSRG